MDLVAVESVGPDAASCVGLPGISQRWQLRQTRTAALLHAGTILISVRPSLLAPNTNTVSPPQAPTVQPPMPSQ